MFKENCTGLSWEVTWVPLTAPLTITTVFLHQTCQRSASMKTAFSGAGIPIIKTRRSYYIIVHFDSAEIKFMKYVVFLHNSFILWDARLCLCFQNTLCISHTVFTGCNISSNNTKLRLDIEISVVVLVQWIVGIDWVWGQPRDDYVHSQGMCHNDVFSGVS